MTLNPHRIPAFLMHTAATGDASLEQAARDLGAQFAKCLEAFPGQLADRNLNRAAAERLIAELCRCQQKDVHIQEAAARDPIPRDPWMSLSVYQGFFLKPGPASDAMSTHLASPTGLEQAFASHTASLLALHADRLAAAKYGEREGQDADDQAALELNEKIEGEWRAVCGSWRPEGLGIFTDLALAVLFQAFRLAAWALRCRDGAGLALAGDLAKSLASFIPLGEHRESVGTWVVLVRRVTPNSAHPSA
jgi:hypothetical protein